MAECVECKRPKASSGALSYRLLSSKEKKAFCVGNTECLRVVIAGLRAENENLRGELKRESLRALERLGIPASALPDFVTGVGGSHLVNGENR